MQPHEITELHASVLGLCAYVSAFPYDVPDMLPQVLVTLGDHLNDPHPIPVSEINPSSKTGGIISEMCAFIISITITCISLNLVSIVMFIT